MKYLLFTLALSFFFFSCEEEKTPSTENFELTFESSEGAYAKAAVKINNAIYILGTSTSSPEKMYLLKIDENGNKIFDKTYSNDLRELGYDIKPTLDGNLLLLGLSKQTYQTNGQYDIYLTKVNTQGQVLWEKTYGSDSAFDLAEGLLETSNGDILLFGALTDPASTFQDFRLMRLNAQGDLLWEKIYASIYDDRGFDLVEAADGNFVLLGRRKDGDEDFYVMKVDGQGNTLWSQSYGGPAYEEAHSISRTSDNGFILCGHSSSVDPAHNLYSVKIDAQGQVEWEKHYGGILHDGGTAAKQLSNGQYIFTGETDSYGNGSKRMFLVKTKADGEVLEETSFGGDASDKGIAILESPSSYFLIGETASLSSNGKVGIYVIKQEK